MSETGSSGWKFQWSFHRPFASWKLLVWFAMDPMLLTGLAGYLLSSVSESSGPSFSPPAAGDGRRPAIR